MRLSFLAPLSLLLPLFAAACGDDPVEATPTPPPPPIAAADFMAAYTKAICARSAQCYSIAAYLDAACEATVRDELGEDVEAAIEGGRIDYDANAAGACVAGLEEMDCLAEQPSDATLKACLSALSGKIATGQPCFGTFECAQGICPSVTGDTCGPKCPAVAQKGEACSLLGGPDCDVRAGLRCSSGTCVAPAERGAACVDNYGCQSGLVCVANVCVSLRGPFQGCAQDTSCQIGNFCAAGGDEGGVCEPRLGVGSTCGGGEADKTNAAFRRVQCEDGLVCLYAALENDGTSLVGTCGEPSDVGGDCTPEPDGYQLYESGCKTGLICDAGQCALPPAAGAACGKHFECALGAYCDPMSLMCLTTKPNGDACAIDKECAGAFCGSDGKCTDSVTFCGP